MNGGGRKSGALFLFPAAVLPGAVGQILEKEGPFRLGFDRLLRMELDGEDWALLEGLDDSVISAGGNRDSLAGALDSLVVVGIDRQAVLPEDAVQRAALFYGDPVQGAMSCSPRQIARIGFPDSRAAFASRRSLLSRTASMLTVSFQISSP